MTQAGRRSSTGFTIIEMLIVLAVLGILITIGVLNVRPPALRLAANSMQAFVQQARFEAIKTNRQVVVSFDESGSVSLGRVAQMTTRVDCGSAVPLRSFSLDEYRGVTSSSSDGEFVWLPTGQPRLCGADPLPSAGISINLSDGAKSMTVSVNAAGEVGVR